ncbi:HAD family hydrolase [Pseudonocardia endophytica]|uniref:Phosphoglycolate phosphatase n=1 Tax=Pseudonocardia endophytica TaxID=401976 RepID=A0A4R1HKF1_PSEEN|nr:HAD hydrolase-like protein [Pseudonocardia endophytica]TCK21423.1 phosphoglycolate phosphatase [Pseudonocardia endophytica]
MSGTNAPTAPVEAVIFDLDGTLVQTRVASWTIFSQINDRFELGVDGPEQYFDLFRGNVYSSLAKLCRDESHAGEVKSAFLDLLRNEYDPPLVPGLSDVVRRLAGHCTLAVMSSNAMQVMRRVLSANELAFCFAHVFGGDVTPDKRTAMRLFLDDAGNSFGRRCSADYDETGARQAPGLSTTVLVTDTAGDVRDARDVGIRAVGVAWGMHSVDELLAAGAEFVALWPQELTSHLLGDGAAAPASGACAIPAPAGPDDQGGCGCDTSTPVVASADATADDAGAARRRRRRQAARVLARGVGTDEVTSARRAIGDVPSAEADAAESSSPTERRSHTDGGRRVHWTAGPADELLVAVRRVIG